MSNRHFGNLLAAKQAAGKFVCVGLDPDRDKILKIPRQWSHLDSEALQFCKEIVDATKDFAGAYKPNIAFFERDVDCGLAELEELVDRIHDVAPDAPVILDFKRGDIGNSNLGYIELLDEIGADACTVHGYMGQETWQPLLDRPEKGVFVLCRTSNPGAAEFQELKLGLYDYELEEITGQRGWREDWKDYGWRNAGTGEAPIYQVPLYEYVAGRVARRWNNNGNCGLVVGATAPEQLAAVRRLAPNLPILIPGIGKQGGDLEAAVRNGMNANGAGFIINASSSIVYASSGPDFADAARAETERLTNEINSYREVVHA